MSQGVFEQFREVFRYRCASKKPTANLGYSLPNIRTHCELLGASVCATSLCITATAEAERGHEMEIRKGKGRGRVEMRSKS